MKAKLKKYWPLAVFAIGLVVFGGVFAFVKLWGKGGGLLDEDALVAEIPLEQRPQAKLIPSEDGHWLKMIIEDIKIEAYSVDYELLYKVGDGRTQGVPGTVKLQGLNKIERDLLLGSESSGKFRYDEGVETGTLTLRFRNEKGKLVGKLTTEFHLLTNTKNLTTVDKKFSYTLNSLARDVWFVVMETFGLPGDAPGDLRAGPYGVFASGKGPYPGKVEGANYYWTGSMWKELTNGKSSDLGIFVSLAE